MAPPARADCARPPPDTSPRPITTEVTTDRRRDTPLRTTVDPRPGTARRAHLAISPHTRLSTVRPGPLTETAGAGLRPATA